MSDLTDMIDEGGGATSISRALGIPLRTVEDWKAGRRHPPDWLPPLLANALRRGQCCAKDDAPEVPGATTGPA